MNFLAPLGLLLGLFVPAVIALYLLKLKRIDTPISSTLLWRQSLEDLKANTPFQKLKQNLLMYLQILLLALLALAVARPVMELGGLQGQSFIVLIDHSASMNAADVAPSRLEQAKQLAIDLVNDMSMGDRMMVVSFAAGAQVLSPFESDKGKLRAIIDAIPSTDTPTRFEEAMRIARSAADVQPNAEVVIFSDGGFDAPNQSLGEDDSIRYIPMGESGENAGIVDLVVRQDYTLEQTYQVLAGIENAGGQTREVYVELYGEGTVAEAAQSATPVATPSERMLLDARRITLPPGGYDTIIFESPGAFPRILEVVVDSDDPLPLDNRAWALVQPRETIDVLLVTANNYFLERVLNIDENTRVVVVPPSEYPGPQDFDVVVFDSFAPETLEAGNFLFINAVPPLPNWSAGETLSLPAIIDYDRFHPIARYINFENLIINRARNLAAPEWAEVILESTETPLLLAFEDDPVRGVVTAFDIYDTNWPYRVSFPIFFANTLDWLLAGEKQTLMHRTGDVLTLLPDDFANAALQLVPPEPLSPQPLVFEGGNPLYFDRTQEAGIYRIEAEDSVQQRYAVNLLSAQETRIAPAERLAFEDTEVVGEAGSVASNQEIWRWLVAGGLLVLLIEWLLYVKRARYSF